jgi:hypothetical protein
VAHVGHQTAEGGGDAGHRAGTSTVGIAGSAGEGHGVQRPRAPEGEEDEVVRVAPPLERDQPDGAGHLVVGHAHDGGGRGDGIEGQVRADLGVDDRAHLIEARAARHAEECVRIEPAQEQVGVGDGGLLAAAAVGE